MRGSPTAVSENRRHAGTTGSTAAQNAFWMSTVFKVQTTRKGGTSPPPLPPPPHEPHEAMAQSGGRCVTKRPVEMPVACLPRSRGEGCVAVCTRPGPCHFVRATAHPNCHCGTQLAPVDSGGPGRPRCLEREHAGAKLMCLGSRCCQSRGPGSPELCRACALERRIRGDRSAPGEVRFSPLARGGGSIEPPPPPRAAADGGRRSSAACLAQHSTDCVLRCGRGAPPHLASESSALSHCTRASAKCLSEESSSQTHVAPASSARRKPPRAKQTCHAFCICVYMYRKLMPWSLVLCSSFQLSAHLCTGDHRVPREHASGGTPTAGPQTTHTGNGLCTRESPP